MGDVDLIGYEPSMGLRENLQENPICHGKIMEHLWFPVGFPLNQPLRYQYLFFYLEPPAMILKRAEAPGVT